MKKERLVGIDVLKIICALLIFGRHAIKSGGCHFFFGNYLMDTIIVELTGPVMILFFMMSGFSIQYVYGEKDIYAGGGIIRYYFKRLVALLPMYFFVHIVSSFLYGHDMRAVIRLIPIETIGIQAWFDSLFGFVHNGGTWFVSCLLVAYFVYPLLAQILKGMKLEIRVMILVILMGMQIYSLYTISYFGGNIYSSPLFRTVDFTIGVVLCSIRDCTERKFKDWIYCIISIISAAILCECFLSKSYWDNFLYVPLGVLLYNVVSITCKGEIFKTKIGELITDIIGYASSLSYAFYILQCILWRPFFEILNRYPIFEENSKRGMLAFGLLFLASIALHEIYEKPLKKVLLKYYEKYKTREIA